MARKTPSPGRPRPHPPAVGGGADTSSATTTTPAVAAPLRVRSAMHRSQSAKSVRILDAPTEFAAYDATADSDSRGDSDSSRALRRTSSNASASSNSDLAAPRNNVNNRSSVSPPVRVKRVSLTTTGAKRTSSSSKLKTSFAASSSAISSSKSHARKGSSSAGSNGSAASSTITATTATNTSAPSLRGSTGSTNTGASTHSTGGLVANGLVAPFVQQQPPTLALPNGEEPRQLQPPQRTSSSRLKEEREPERQYNQLQPAPHVTKAINLRRNNSSLANLITAEPRSVSRGFELPQTQSSAAATVTPTATSAPLPSQASIQSGSQQDLSNFSVGPTCINPETLPSCSTSAAANLSTTQPRNVTGAANTATGTPILQPPPPPPSPASPAVTVPSSVILPPQPRPSPADPRIKLHTPFARPSSPPAVIVAGAPPASAGATRGADMHAIANAQTRAALARSDDGAARIRSTPRRESPHHAGTHAQDRQGKGAVAAELASKAPVNGSMSSSSDRRQNRRAQTMPLPEEEAGPSAPRDMETEPLQLTKEKKRQMFFISSPTTDSDDEGGIAKSLGKRVADLQAAAKSSSKDTGKKEVAQTAGKQTAPREQHQPSITVDKPRASSDSATKKTVRLQSEYADKVNSQEHEVPEEDEDDDDDDGSYEDEDDSEWSSETSESEEDERQVAMREEEERQRLMFAKRTPSAVAAQGGLLSMMFRSDEYNRGYANMPAHLRTNSSVMHLNTIPNVGGLSAAMQTSHQPQNGQYTLNGVQASKSTAALANLDARTKLVPTKSGNHLTRLGGMPSGVELESDDEEDDEGRGNANISHAQEQQLATLMQKTVSANPRLPSQQQQPSESKAKGLAPPMSSVVGRTSAAAQAPPPGPVERKDQAPAAIIFTPRTTRRNMLATELTESLRASLLAERQSRSRLAAGGIGNIVNAVSNRLAGNKAGTSAPADAQNLSAQRVQRGSAQFPQAPAASTQQLNGHAHPQQPARLPNVRANSDPVQQTEYYSMGYHHTGW